VSGWGHKIIVTVYVEGPASDDMAVNAAEDFAQEIEAAQASVAQVRVATQALRNKPRRGFYPAWEREPS
jgi:hypothetical protein